MQFRGGLRNESSSTKPRQMFYGGDFIDTLIEF